MNYRERNDVFSLHCGGIVIFEEGVPDEYFLKEYSIFRGKERHKNTVKAKCSNTFK